MSEQSKQNYFGYRKKLQNVFLKIFYHLFFSIRSNDFAFQVTALQCINSLKKLTPWRDSNSGSFVQ
jgi:hypothetical protein